MEQIRTDFLLFSLSINQCAEVAGRYRRAVRYFEWLRGKIIRRRSKGSAPPEIRVLLLQRLNLTAHTLRLSTQGIFKSRRGFLDYFGARSSFYWLRGRQRSPADGFFWKGFHRNGPFRGALLARAQADEKEKKDKLAHELVDRPLRRVPLCRINP